MDKTLIIETLLLIFGIGIMVIPTFYRIKKLKEKER
ncbi:hypothetical protein CLV39_0652 [Hydrogenothermus marinus]|uniref:Uncharacterized protein n=1 Tax=Hydrogenothermus marinus TaxID=133270 RepID=A0A3M0BI11_9AQUI|nr:hypothetical protein CLV39_0652 [Hydrogenothermus marinus]